MCTPAQEREAVAAIRAAISAHIRKVRIQRGVRPGEVSRKLGVHSATQSRAESGGNVSLEYLDRLADHFDDPALRALVAQARVAGVKQ